jgi:hypothetical protein
MWVTLEATVEDGDPRSGLKDVMMVAEYELVWSMYNATNLWLPYYLLESLWFQIR